MNDSPKRAARNSSDCSQPGTRTAKCAWRGRPNKLVRQIYTHTDPKLAIEHVAAVGRDLQDDSCPPEVQSLGRTIIRWKDQIAAWHKAHVSNGPTEAANDLYELVTERAGCSLIITSNRTPEHWYPLFPNPVVAESVLDRIINTAHHIHLDGRSYRPTQRPKGAATD